MDAGALAPVDSKLDPLLGPALQADCALLSTDAIAGRIIEAKGFDAADAAMRKAIGEQALALLRSFRKRGTVEQIGLGRRVRWRLASES
jgi:hypothetical protein